MTRRKSAAFNAMKAGLFYPALFGLLCAAAAPCRAGLVDDLAQGNKLYEAGGYAQAVEKYRDAAAAEPGSPTAHFNLGNAYFRRAQAGDLGRAVASYQRAFLLSPRDADLRYNLDFALKRAGESLIPPGMPAAAFLLFHLLSRQELTLLHALGFWPFLLLLSIGFWSERLRERLKAWTFAAGTLWLIAASWWLLIAWMDVENPGVILAQEAEVRSGPGLNSSVSFKAPEGRRVSLLEEKDGWVQIGVLKEGLKGWLPAGQVERI